MSLLLKLEGLTKRFGGLTAVHDVSLDLAEMEILGLIGPNGAGKTTLFNMISGTYLPTNGRITYEGQDITDLPSHEIAALGIARTFQIAKPFARLSVVDNVMVGSFLRTKGSGLASDKARQVVDFVGLESHADRPAQTLTTAGRKRLELARALATEPKLLLLDEVMAGLTPTESAGIVNLIRQIREAGITILVIEHVMKAIMSLSDRVAVIHHGELIAVDPPQDVAKDPRVIEAYLGEEYQIAENQ
ncbi:MAG: ABC transporter ATP-binding protein [Chloroflexota bacterium]|nr:MAG: ABC transporter ATP-binding protein [Chloroflexota bacterium]